VLESAFRQLRGERGIDAAERAALVETLAAALS
jgi:hypothetical protein